MAKIISRRERERLQREMDRRVEDAKEQLADEDIVERLSRDTQQAEDAWVQDLLDNLPDGIVDINYIPLEDC